MFIKYINLKPLCNIFYIIGLDCQCESHFLKLFEQLNKRNNSVRDNNQDITWQQLTQHPVLNDSQVHVWRANLDLPTNTIEQLTSYLSEDEIARAYKFRFQQHQRRFIAARGILRQILGNYLQISPPNLQFEYSDRGKPSISNNALQFNVSHSHEYALYGFTYQQAIGVDLEYTRSMPDTLKIAQRFFSPREFKLISDVTSEQQSTTFFKIWTAKEAYLKAVGTGLSGSLSAVEISLDLDLHPQLIAIDGSTTALSNWSIYPCIPTTDYQAAIAISTPVTPDKIYLYNWHP
ncbi:phosphopantetheine-protein transferase [Chondrocystis sp. NIES-4102]|nr:phosphopantetheine-protein transferase [Chondrocystis sp. NIES-4102]